MNTDIFLNALVAYFVVIDPLGVSLIFNALVKGQESHYCRKIAFSAAALSLLVIMGFGFFGARLLAQLGITLHAFRIAGGLLLFHTAFCMAVHPETKPDKSKTPSDIAVFPLTFPLLAGPGCLTLTILLFSQAHDSGGGILSLISAIIVILVVTLSCMLLSGRIARLIGSITNSVIQRLLGVLLAALSIQFVADGVLGLLNAK
jgi:multiple antibiotic resistance protein